MEEMSIPDHLRRYIEYIHNTGQRPLQCAAFDDDWEPIGPMVRRDLLAAGLIEEYEGWLMPLVDDHRSQRGTRSWLSRV